MSKMQDLLTRIQAVLESTDQSATPELRRLAEQYAAACNELNRQLAECARLLASGVIPDALAADRACSPSLSERARLLAFPRRAEWRALCSDYGYPVAAEPDLGVVEALEKAADSGALLSGLLARWRRLARGGEPAEKLRILRQILAAVPGDDRSWRRQLIEVETHYLPQLLDRAEAALAQGDAAVLEARFQELNSPELLTAPDAGRMAALAQAVGALQREKLTAEAGTHLAAIAQAYSDGNADELENRLRAWRDFASDPRYQPGDAVALQLAEAEKFIAETRASEARAAEFSESRSRLLEALDSDAPLAEINRLFGALEMTGLPIEPLLRDRVETDRENRSLADRRRHIRRCLLGVVAAVLLAAGLGAAILLTQARRERAGWRDGLSKAIAAGDFGGALESWTTLEKSNPELARDGELLALKNRAEQLRTQWNNAEVEFNGRLAGVAELLRTAPESPDFSKRFEELEKRKNGRSAGARKQYEQLLARYRRIVRDSDERRKKEFLEQSAKFLALINRVEASFASPETDPEQAGQPVAAARQVFESVCRAGVRLPPELVARERERLKLRLETFDRNLLREKQKRELTGKLTRPRFAAQYLEALEQIQSDPVAAVPYRYAIDRISAWRDELVTPTERDLDFTAPTRTAQTLVLNRRSTSGIDLWNLSPADFAAPDPLAALKKQLKKWETESLPVCDLYELVFFDSAGVRYRFYTEAAPVSERRIASREVKALSLAAVIADGERGRDFALRVVRRNGKIEFEPAGKLAGSEFPPGFVRGENFILPGTFRKARHAEFLRRMIDRLKKVNAPARLDTEIFALLRELRKDSAMNPYLRRLFARELLDLLPVAANFYQTEIPAWRDGIVPNLDARPWNWRHPREEADHPDEIAQLAKALDTLPVEQFEARARFRRESLRRALLRAVEPAVMISGGKPVWFGPPEPDRELWRIVGRGSDLRVQRLTARSGTFRSCSEGELLFAPVDRVPIEKASEPLRKLAAETGITADRWPCRWPENRE